MEYGLARKGVGLPELLTHIPMIWNGPGIKPRPEVGETAFVSMADVMPTICEAMGAEIPPGVQGRSLLPLLKGEAFPAEEFRSITAQVGVGGLSYDEKDDITFTVGRGEGGYREDTDGKGAGWEKGEWD